MGDHSWPPQEAIQLQEYHRRWQSQIGDTRAPLNDVQETERRDAGARSDEAYQTWRAALGNSDAAYSNNCKKKKQRAIAELERVTRRHRRELLEKRQEDGLREHLDILGLPFCVRVYNQWFADQQAPPTLVQDQVEGEALSANTTPESRPSPPPGSPGPLTERERTYSEVTNEGKYVIVFYQDFWYIVDCVMHPGKISVHCPLQSAQNHLRKEEHYGTKTNSGISITWAKVIADLGTRVLQVDKIEVEGYNNSVIEAQTVRNQQRTLNGPSTRTRSSLNTIVDDNTDAASNSGRALPSLKPYNPRESDVPYKPQGKEYLRERGRLRRCNAEPTESPVGNDINIADDAFTNASSEVFYNRTAGTDYLSLEERRSSIAAGKQAIRRTVTVAPDVLFPACDGLPRDEQPCRSSDNGPDFDHHGDHMELDTHTISDSADGSDSSDSTGYSQSFVRSTFQLSSTNCDSHLHQEVEDLSMSGNAQAGPSSRSAVVKDVERSNAKVQARDATAVAYSRILANLG